MKIKLWMATTLLATVLITSCSKKSGLSPEDTALIKGTDRGTFTGSSNDLAGGENENDLSPIGSTISGLGGEDGLMPQDPFWSDPDTIQNAERPFDPIFFGFDQYNIGTDERQKLHQYELEELNSFKRLNDGKGTIQVTINKAKEIVIKRYNQ